jgi:O-succinylbenzoic acid--CoA ligase
MSASHPGGEALVGRVRASLVASGVGPGSRVAALVADTPAAIALFHAAWALGGAVAPLNRRSAGTELATQLSLVAPRVLVHDEAHAERAAVLAALLDIATLSIEGAGAPWPSVMTVRPAEVDPAGEAAVMATSGTTGLARAALLRHRQLAASADAWAAILAPRSGDRWLLSLPLFHVAGLAILVRAARWGAGLEVPVSTDADALAGCIRAGASHLSLVPTQLERLLASLREPPPATLRAVLLGGGPVPGDLLSQAREASIPVLTTYGLTETASGIAVGGAEPATLADPTALRPLPGVSVRISGSGADGGRGESEIEVRGAMVVDGYLGEPDGRSRSANGWLPTGDLGTLDASGLLRVTGRLDDLFISGGENVQPAEVEAVLREHPDVVDGAVVGRPDAAWGAVPVAAVVLRPGASLDVDALQGHCRARLAGFKVPADITAVRALPRNATGKLLRHEVRAMLAGRPR